MALTPVDSYADLATALYGEGAWEIVKAMSSEDKRKAGYRAAMTGNALATVGGLHAMGLSIKHFSTKAKPRTPGPAKLKPVLAKLPGAQRGANAAKAALIKNPKLAAGAAIAGSAGWVGLHGAELAADAAGAHAIHSNYKRGGSPKGGHGVHKGLFKKKEEQPKAKLMRIGAAAGAAAATQAKTELKKQLDFVIKGEISKSNDKRQVFGWASVVELNGQPVVDLQGDYMAIDVIEKAAYDYVHSSRRGGDMHSPGSHASDLIESFIVTPEKKAQLGLPDEMPVGWWVGFQVNDDEVWKMVKDGKRPEFSIHGSGQRVDVEL